MPETKKHTFYMKVEVEAHEGEDREDVEHWLINSVTDIDDVSVELIGDKVSDLEPWRETS